MNENSRREFLGLVGWSSAAWALAGWLPSLARGRVTESLRRPPQRVVIVFSPNGVVPEAYWPEQTGSEFGLPEILQPLEEFRSRLLLLGGIDNRIRGDGDDHMRGMGCLLTGIELAPGNIQGGSNTPAGWPRGPSIDQVLGRHLQSDPATQSRFPTLEFGVNVPERADVWTRMVYAEANRPITPVSDPASMLRRMYGKAIDLPGTRSLLDQTAAELEWIARQLPAEDRRLLDEHLTLVREAEQKLTRPAEIPEGEPPRLPASLPLDDANMPVISAAQQELLVTAFRSNQTRIATLQYTNSVGNARMTFLGIEEGHHELSHEPDDKTEAREKLVRINRWYAGQIAELARRLQSTPEPDGDGNLLDHTTIFWTNELGKGNSHSLSHLPMLVLGGGTGWATGRHLQFRHMPHNRLWISLAHSMGLPLTSFGNPVFCEGGPIAELQG